ncbi:YiiD C-terminal domain-containing protein [Nitrospira sp. T9]|uniref:YiiD C-terminal domain-containing protein n=1 Tax=unclassified Nitrospira TaxID=2652172 RepID=UPI003F97E00A
MKRYDLEQYLHEHIPLSRAMGVEVIEVGWNGVTLRAPLAPNINHRETVFGGSASAVAILAAWAILYVRLHQEHVKCRLVIQRNTMTYERPIASTFEASSTIQDSLAWEKFLRTFARKNLARISVAATLSCTGEQVGKFEGDFVALTMKQD